MSSNHETKGPGRDQERVGDQEASNAGADSRMLPNRAAVTAGTAPAVSSGGGIGAAGGKEPATARLDRRGVLLGLLTAGGAVVAGAGAAAWRACSTMPADAEGAAASGRTTAVTVEVEGMRFVPETVEVPVGDRLVLALSNTGDQVHDLVVQMADGTTVSTGRVAVGDTGSLDAGIVSGPLEAWCSIAGHRAQGMVLHITASGRVATAPTTTIAPGRGGAAVADHAAVLPEGVAAFDAALAPADTSTTVHEYTFNVTEQTMYVGGGVTQRRMTYNGGVPGPVLRGKVGDTFRVTLVNDGSMSHSIDFHAGVIPPDEVMRSIDPGESLVYEFAAQRSGIWLYHCSTAPMSVHLASGMHGAVIIDPPGLGRADREYVLIQSEIYLGPEGGETDADKVATKTPDLIAFNGIAFQYRDRPLTAEPGERVRIWVLDAGPSLPTSFHAVGLQFDQVFSEGNWTLGGPAHLGAAWSGGGQALGLQPAQGGFVECVPPAPGTYTLVSHAFADMEKGAMGYLKVTG
ncbi:multicopper oxidase domain-containing protein [Actinomyces qiguomingii]|uniref:multicopper oxidase domain-containing protein n=1 Tax=Actinomyces qiguomingii TaxID=2057800 RepID=UPI00143D62D8|nr:multicopper oxidase domain-containing protein [Actinomyces qiguomingii]